MITLKDFCGARNSTFIFVVWNKNNFGACFEALTLIFPANLLLAVSSAIFCFSRSGVYPRGFPITFLTWTKLILSSLSVMEIVVETSISAFLESPLSPVYLFINAIIGLTWILNSVALWKMRYLFFTRVYLPDMQIVFTFLVICSTTLQFYSVVVKFEANELGDKHQIVQSCGTITRFAIQILYVILLVPCVNTRSIYQKALKQTTSSASIQAGTSSEKRPLLHSSSIHVLYSGHHHEHSLGIAEDGSNFFSKLVFWWVKPLMVNGYKGKLQQPHDLFSLPESLSTKKIKVLFFNVLFDTKLCDSKKSLSSDTFEADVRIKYSDKKTLEKDHSHCEGQQRTLLSALHHAFGLQYYSIGLLKLFGDCLSFAGPLLLHAIVSFMENRNVSYYNEMITKY